MLQPPFRFPDFALSLFSCTKVAKHFCLSFSKSLSALALPPFITPLATFSKEVVLLVVMEEENWYAGLPLPICGFKLIYKINLTTCFTSLMSVRMKANKKREKGNRNKRKMATIEPDSKIVIFDKLIKLLCFKIPRFF